MKKELLLPAMILLGQQLFSQTLIDTTLFIQNIDVQGKRFAGVSGGEIKKLQVEDNLTSMTGTTAEAFRQIPSLITDMEGGVTFRGADKPGMLIDGIPYGMLEEYSGDVLIQLPALFFNKISLGQFPLVNLVPDGDAGVLNLSSAMFGKNDSPLIVTLGAGWNERYNAGAILNLHPAKFHITAKYNYRKEYRERTFSKSTATLKNRTEMNNNAVARPDVHLADLKVGYDLSSKDQITIHGLYYLMDYSRYGRINNRVFNPQGEQLKYVIRNRYNDQKQEAYAVEAYWNHRFSNNSNLYTVFNYNNFIYNEDNDFKNENPESGKIVAEDNQFFNRKKHNYYWSAGYSLPFSENWIFNVGYIGRSKVENYDTDANNKINGNWVSNDQKIYNYRFHRSLNLLYASLERKWNDFEAEVGLHVEVNKQTMEQFSPFWVNSSNSVNVGLKTDNTYFHLYPRARFSYQMGKNNQLIFSYQQRVIRPDGSDLSSFLDNSDVTHISQGNPDLKDEFIHTLELGYQLTVLNFRLSPALYYRNRTNRIMEVASQVNDETIWMKDNAGNSQTVGFDISMNWSPFKNVSVGLSGDVYRDEIDGRMIGYDNVKKSLTCWDIKGNVNVNITRNTEFQVDGFFISDQLTPQGKIKSHYSVNAGLSHYFIHRKLRANLSINNIFDTLEEIMVIDTENLQMTQKRNRDARVAWLTLTYNL
ncbi:outer membrane beta-barrel family protein [Parabacteroides chinchillae]|uniref:Outer membrane receptor proteins, mostly Fe transport n=1 Tax=Parabacteroides chinchillae TaxID=871327 RepID=A0A8G2BXL3_9BACT|nr:outer membrane beta-barrel family protein [Parabacteroides chinchillae]SEG07229.1 Outer membrane receptor proteins, mostly Fe transport [Parabacteroides chinchillae]